MADRPLTQGTDDARQAVADQITVCLARHLAGLRKVQIGVNAPLSEAAALLARRLASPPPTVYVMGMASTLFTPEQVSVFRGEWAALSEGTHFPLELIVDLIGGWEGVDDEPVHPLQVAPNGAVTLHGLAAADGGVELMGPGPAGLDMLPFMLRGAPTVYLTEHSPRTLVAEPLWLGVGDRQRKRSRAEVTVITELCVLSLSPTAQRVTSLHPWATTDEVHARTGFAVEIAEDVAGTQPPSDRELALLAEVDPADVRVLELIPAAERHRRVLELWEQECHVTVEASR